MRRQIGMLLAMLTTVWVTVPGAAAGETSHETVVVFEGDAGNWLPDGAAGTYRAFTIVAIGGTMPNPSQNQACVNLTDWTVAGTQYLYTRHIEGCTAFDAFTVADSLRSGTLQATISGFDCREQVPNTRYWNDCHAVNVDVSLSMTGAGPVDASHDGFRFEYPAGGRSTYVMNARSRSLEVTGTVGIGGESLLAHPWRRAQAVLGSSMFVSTAP